MERSSSKNKKIQNRTFGARKIKKYYEKTSYILGNGTF